MTAAAGLAAQAVLGLALGLQFNPWTGTAGAVIAALVFGYPKAPESRRPIAVAVLALAWLAGDGVRIGRDIAATPPHGWAAWAPLAIWALVSAVVGYALPAAAGIMVGHRVTRGTGWLSAGAVAFMVSGALALASPALADVVARLGGGA